MDITDRMNLTKLNASPVKTGSPNATALIHIYRKLSTPPIKSKNTLARDQPTVDLRE